MKIGSSSWSAVTAGVSNVYAIRNDGGLFSWGINTLGQLGVGSAQQELQYSSPVQIGASSWTSVAANQNNAFALRTDGALFAWGDTGQGLIDNNSNLPLVPLSWIQVSQGGETNCAIRSDGALFTWGTGTYGPLGYTVSVPTQVGLSSWIMVSLGQNNQNDGPSSTYTGYAIRQDGALFTWGSNSMGQLADDSVPIGFYAYRSSPVQVGTSSWISVAGGSAMALAIRADGALFAWGLNEDGQLGNTDRIHRSSPVQIGASSWSMVSAFGGVNYKNSFAIRKDGALFAWGSNNNGSLGINADGRRSSPVQIGTSSWVQITCTNINAYAIDISGALFGWGNAGAGQLGQNNLIEKSSPVQIGSSSWSVVSANVFTVSAIRTDGALFTWGFNDQGQLGQNDRIHRSSPVQVGTSSWSILATGGTPIFNKVRMLGILSQKELMYGWGYNRFYEIGDGTQIHRSSPVQIGSITQFETSPVQVTSSSYTAVTAGLTHVGAIRSDSNLFTWGLGSSGQLGLTVGQTSLSDWTAQRSSPVQVGSTYYVASPVQIGSNSWSQLAAGASHMMALNAANVLFTWGFNTTAQLGDGSTINRSSPVQIGSKSWSQISGGQYHSLAIDNSNKLFGWGDVDLYDISNNIASNLLPLSWVSISSSKANDSSLIESHYTGAVRSDGALITFGFNGDGQLGDGTVINRSSPVQIGSSSWISVSAGTSMMAAIRSDGALFTWGSNSNGDLGLGDRIHRSSPVQIGTSSWSQVSASGGRTVGNFVLAIKNDYSLWGWGLNAGGRLGLNDNTARSSPTQIGSSSWTQVSTGISTSAAIRTDGGLFTWGINSFGQLGLNDVTHRSSPVQVGTSSWSQVSVGSINTGAISQTGALFMWGDNFDGQIGNNLRVNLSSPVQIGTSSWTSVSCGENYFLAIRSDNALFACGINNSTFGDSTTLRRSSPIQIGTSSWTSISAGDRNSAGVSNNLLFCWGENDSGGIGLNDRIHRSSPVQVGTVVTVPYQLSTSNYSQVAAGYSHSLVTDTSNYLYGWGNFAARTFTSYSWTQIVAGDQHTLAIRNDGALFTWGLGTSGQLGSNAAISRSSPVQVGTSSWSQVAGGTAFSAAIRTDGALFTWGLATSGQLGDGFAISRSSPVQVGTTSSWNQIALGNTHTLARSNTNQLFVWGLNTNGGLGLNDRIHRSSPVQVGAATDWTNVQAGTLFSLALNSSGALYTWGLGTSGQLGSGLALSRSSPVQVGTSSWSTISAGLTHTMAIRNDGGLFTWGLGTSGELGSNEALSRSSPVQVGTSSWTSIAAGNVRSWAIRSDNTLFGWGFGTVSIGDNTTISRSSPVQIGSEKWSSVDAKAGFAIGNYQNNIYGRTRAWGAGSAGQQGNNNVIDTSSPVQVGTFSDYISNTTPTSIITQIGAATYNKVYATDNYSYVIDTNNVLFGWGANPNKLFSGSLQDQGISAAQVGVGPTHQGAIKAS